MIVDRQVALTAVVRLFEPSRSPRSGGSPAMTIAAQGVASRRIVGAQRRSSRAVIRSTTASPAKVRRAV